MLSPTGDPFFSPWQVGQYAYYAKVTESAEKSMKGCAAAVLQAFQKMMDFFQTASSSQILNGGFQPDGDGQIRSLWDFNWQHIFHDYG